MASATAFTGCLIVRIVMIWGSLAKLAGIPRPRVIFLSEQIPQAKNEQLIYRFDPTQLNYFSRLYFSRLYLRKRQGVGYDCCPVNFADKPLKVLKDPKQEPHNELATM